MRFAKTFFVALAATFAAVATVKSVPTAGDSTSISAEEQTSAVCNPNTGQCARVRWSDGTSTI